MNCLYKNYKNIVCLYTEFQNSVEYNCETALIDGLIVLTVFACGIVICHIRKKELKENKKSGQDGREIQAAREKERDGKGWKRELQLENLNTQG